MTDPKEKVQMQLNLGVIELTDSDDMCLEINYQIFERTLLEWESTRGYIWTVSTIQPRITRLSELFCKSQQRAHVAYTMDQPRYQCNPMSCLCDFLDNIDRLLVLTTRQIANCGISELTRYEAIQMTVDRQIPITVSVVPIACDQQSDIWRFYRPESPAKRWSPKKDSVVHHFWDDLTSSSECDVDGLLNTDSDDLWR